MPEPAITLCHNNNSCIRYTWPHAHSYMYTNKKDDTVGIPLLVSQLLMAAQSVYDNKIKRWKSLKCLWNNNNWKHSHWECHQHYHQNIGTHMHTHTHTHKYTFHNIWRFLIGLAVRLFDPDIIAIVFSSLSELIKKISPSTCCQIGWNCLINSHTQTHTA